MISFKVTTFYFLSYTNSTYAFPTIVIGVAVVYTNYLSILSYSDFDSCFVVPEAMNLLVNLS